MFPRAKRLVRSGLLAGLLLMLGLTSCTTNHYRKSADREAYRVIESKTPQVHNMDPNFTIEQTNVIALDGLATVSEVPEFLGPDGEQEKGAHVLTLEDALKFAVKYS